MFELSKQFRFEAAHTLERRIDSEASRRIHGHSYRTEVTIRGLPDQASGMVVDLGLFQLLLAEVRNDLDHCFLDDVPDLGPATLENLSSWIWNRLYQSCPALLKVTVFRDSEGDSCTYFGPGDLKIGE
jgi:6-pyruvoyltetrahydropterin/6-carboxytetrahydropterin synthase